MNIRMAICFYVVAVLASVYPVSGVAQPIEDRMLCEDGLLDSVVSATGLSNVDTFLSSCRKDPVQSGQAIVALVRPRTEGGHAGDAAGSTRFDVDMVIWDIAKQAIVARGTDPGVLLSDASPLRGTSIDTARYAVAPGVRAFGLRDEHFPHSHDSQWSETYLSLYVRKGDTIKRVFRTQVLLTVQGETSKTCNDPLQRAIRTTIGIGQARHEGYADLIVSTQDADEDGYPPKPCGNIRTEKEVSTYDGTTYGPVAIRMYLHPFD
jgi:hypothetical protein